MKKIPRLFLLRAGAILVFAAVVLVMAGPEVNRLLIAGVLVFVLLPVNALLEYRFPTAQTQWVAPLPELLMTIALVQLAPEYWHTAVCIALMVALAPSINSSKRPEWVHALMGSIVIVGMGATGWWHRVEHWEITMLAVLVVYPPIVAYAAALSRQRGNEKSQAQALTSLNLIAGSVAHRFSNAMMAVTGNLELTLEELPRDHPHRKYLEDALQGAEKAGETSRQLATFAGGTVDTHRQVRIASELDILVGLMRLIIPDDIELQYEPPEEEPVVTGNRFQLQQVIMSAMLKISEGMQHPGCLRITCSREAKVVVEIRDAAVTQADYRQVDRSVFGIRTGDLSDEVEPLETQDGTLQLAMADGRIVALRLLLVGQAVEEPAAPEPVAESTTRRILVIDDEDAVRNTLVSMLKHLGCEPVGASGGEEGLRILKESDFDFERVFLDLKMPGMDGWETLARIRSFREDLPVTIASGYDPRSERERPAMHVAYLQKPFTLAGIKKALS